MACDVIWTKDGEVLYNSRKTDSFPFFYQSDKFIVGPNHGTHQGVAVNKGFYYRDPCSSTFISSHNGNIFDIGEYISGRVFIKFKVISFWNYPTISDFKKIIDLLEQNFNIKFWNNNWKVEIYKGDYNFSTHRNVFPHSYEEYLEKFEWVPIEDYVGGGKVPKEFYLQHLQSPLKKQDNVSTRFPGYKHKKLKGQLPGEIEVAARARMYQERLVTKFSIFENNSNNLTLYHGTNVYNANLLVKNGWYPSNFTGSNMGNPSYLYLSSEPEDALWFANENGGETIVEVNVPIKYLKPDPEDESGFSLDDLMNRMSRKMLPSKFVLHHPLDSSHFKIL